MKVVLNRIVAAVPFLGFPIIGPIVSLILGKVLGMVGDELVLMWAMKKIDIKVGREDEAYTESKVKLEEELKKPVPNQEQLDAAKEEFKKNFQRLIDFKYK